MSVTQQIKDRLDIVQYIGEHVPDLKKAGRYYKACCPFHGEKTPSFVVNPETQSWRCFGACAEGGDIFTFAQKMQGWDFSQALRELGQQAGVEVRKRSPQQKAQEENNDKLRGMLETAAKWYHEHIFNDDKQAQETLAYTIEKRGFSEETIHDWEIGYAPPGWQNMLDALKIIGYSEDEIIEGGLATRNDKGRVYDRFRNRLMIPIRDERGRVIAFGARILDPDDSPKYLNSPQTPIFDKSKTLFGLDKAKQGIRDTETAVIVEGYMDVIQAHQAGYSNVVAQMGTAMTEAQLQLIAPRYASKIIMALDADDAGQNATRRSLEVARQTLQSDYMGKMSVDIRVLKIDDAKDPDDVIRETPEKWADYIVNAVPVADFVIDLATENLPKNSSVQQVQEIATDLLPILLASENNIYNKDNLQKLAWKLKVNERELLGWVNVIQKEQEKKKKQETEAKGRKLQQNIAPPLPEDEFSYSNNEEPPPFFDFDDINLPPDSDDSYNIQSESLPKPRRLQLSSRKSSRATEAYCLRMLLLEPSMLAQVNRKLRELANDNDHLLNGPLMAFSADDFSQGDYRALLDALHSALRQDDAEPLDYLQEVLDENLFYEMTSLLLDESEEVHQQLGKRLKGEFADIWKEFARSVRPGFNTQADVVRRALQVRHQRLEREQQEVKFLLEDAQHQHDKEAERLYYEQTVPTMRALRLIQQELKQQSAAW